MIVFILFLAYIIVGCIVTALCTYVSDSVAIDADGDPFTIIFIVFWPVTTLPLFVYGLVKKLCDSIFKDDNIE